ncbi:HlyD family efflux transporter periplasmic adaptor subunit [Bradyrhizobium frederickii]|uniref:HlyD family efflux transporter periplasmic adaptor subunit n=1 Tax=Bradyrhizobium frederickii TaxID=2560054 RepID=A0A4Y9L960_9BRAD|nr:efflux RND transporter periplasmic adaptor subunit [Bradyrhizobium frederickii]TFV38894.1 HlyD family efflux transporter periplasmic adaptor subunit [Bradyrhizobium frederickii]
MLTTQSCPKGQLARLGLAVLACLASLIFDCAASCAHEGHDHGQTNNAVSSAYPRVAARSELYEIVGILRDNQLSIYLDDAVTNEPVADATLQVTVGDSTAVEASKAGSGLYTLALPVQPAQSVEVIFSVSAQKGDDLLVDSLAAPQPASPPQAHEHGWLSSSRLVPALAVGAAGLALLLGYSIRSGSRLAVTVSAVASTIIVVLAAKSFGESQTGANYPRPPEPPALSDAPRRLQDGSAFAAKPTQRLLDVRTAVAEPQTIRPAVNLIGRVIADPNRSSIVQSIYGGRVIPNAGAIARIGQTVAKGDVLIQIEPHLPIADRTTILEKVGEIEQLMAVTENKLRRLRPLAERGAVPQGQVNDLESELEGLQARRETVRNSRTGFEELRASTDGIITAAKVVPGQVIQPQDVLFQIADPKSLWVEALAYEDIGLKVPEAATAIAPNGQTIALSHVGTSRALRQHASVVQFAIQEPPAGLNIGQPLNVMLQSGAPVSGLIFPRDTVARSSNGENIVWLHTAAERFESRPVRVLPVDAARVLIASGLSGGERVVVRGTDLINQIR